MSEPLSAQIWIGGRLSRARLPEFLTAVGEARVSLEWGDAVFAPETGEELLASLRDGRLWLCDDQASYGEFPELEGACQSLGLPYTRHSEGKYEYDAEVVEWRPGMAEPLARVGSNHDEGVYVPVKQVEKALKYLEANRTGKARKVLRALCPKVSKLPPFEIV